MGKNIVMERPWGKMELIDSGFQELLNEIGQTVCKQEAEKIRARCGDGYEVDVQRFAYDRTIASVYTATPEAMADNGAHNTLKSNLR